MNQSDLYELQWNNHSKILKNTFDNFRNDNELVDVTLSCEGKKIKAHKVVLSACSEYFLDLFRDNPCQHPIIIMRDISYEAMENILNFMYMGELNIAVEQLNSFLKIAECLQVKGLAVEVAKDENVSTQSNSIQQPKDSEKVNRKTRNNNQDTYHKNPKTFKYSNNALEQMQKETMENKEKIITNVCKTEQLSDGGNTDSWAEREAGEGEVKTEIADLDIFSEGLQYTEHEEGGTSAPGAEMFACTLCEKVFNHCISLKLHLAAHRGLTRCPLCPAVLSRAYDLKVHMRRKHNATPTPVL